MKYKYNPKNKLHRSILFIITFLVFLMNFSLLALIGHIPYILTPEISEKGFIYTDNYHRQTEAFAHGQLHFLDDASSLSGLKDPYDYEARTKVTYLFDTCYYKGKYYSYYTAIPIVFCLLPIYLITHQYFNLVILNLIIMFFAVLVASLLYRKIVEEYIKDVPLILYVLGFITLLFGSNLFYLLPSQKYEIPVSLGILCLFSTIYTLISMDNKKKLGFKSFLAGVLTSFLVCSKPNYVMYYPLIFFIGYIIYKKYLNNKKYIILFFIPCIIIGLSQMYYNYIRFDSIFEFGAKYQLTVFNVPKYIKFSFSRIFRCMLGYIFRPPAIDIYKFPYIFITLYDLNYKYREFFYDAFAVGLVAFPVIIFGIINVFKRENNSFYKFLKQCFYIMFFIVLIFIVINATISGVSEKYSTDLKFVLMFLSIIILLMRYSINKSKEFLAVFISLCILNIFLIVPLTYAGENLWIMNAWKQFIGTS